MFKKIIHKLIRKMKYKLPLLKLCFTYKMMKNLAKYPHLKYNKQYKDVYFVCLPITEI